MRRPESLKNEQSKRVEFPDEDQEEDASDVSVDDIDVEIVEARSAPLGEPVDSFERTLGTA